MKKVSLIMASLVLLFTLAMTSCSNPISDLDVNKTETGPSLAGPANVKADSSFEGIVVLTWNQVKDAKGYQIYRRDNTTGVVTELTPDPTTSADSPLYYLDKVGLRNQLIDKRSYTYTVVSVSGTSPNGRALAPTDVIWNGESSYTVTAKIPNRAVSTELAWIKAPTALDTTVHYADKDVKNSDIITWPVKPNLGYEVVLEYGDKPASYTGEALPVFSQNTYKVGSKTYYRGPDPLDPLGFAEFPSIGGKNTIKITATFIDGTDYYPTVDSQQIALTTAYTVIPAPTNFDATRQLETTETVNLQWNDVEEATAYSVYKIEVVTAGAYDTYLGSWAKVNTTDYIAKDGVHFARDTAPADKTYLYFVVAENDTLHAKSYPSNSKPISLGKIKVAAPTNFKVALLDTKFGSEFGIEPSDTTVQISWTQGNTGVFDIAAEYELTRAVIEFNTENGLPTPVASPSDPDPYHYVGPFVPVNLSDAQKVQDKIVVTESVGANGLAARTYYVYRLVQKKASVDSKPVEDYLVETGAFRKKVDLTLTANRETAIDQHGIVTLRLTEGSSYYVADIASIKLFKRNLYNGNPADSYVEIAHTAATGLTWSTIGKIQDLFFEDKAATDITGNYDRYQYLVRAYNAAGTEIYNEGTHEIKAYTAWGSYSTSGVGIAAASVVGTRYPDTFVQGSVTLDFQGNFLTNAPITVQYRYADSATDLNLLGDEEGWFTTADSSPAGGTAKITRTDGAGSFVYSYEFPPADVFALDQYYQIRVINRWTQQDGSPITTYQSSTKTVRTGYITVSEGFVDSSDPDGAKKIILQSNYIKWSGDPTINVVRTTAFGSDLPYSTIATTDTPTTFTVANLTASGALANGDWAPFSNPFDTAGIIIVPYSNPSILSAPNRNTQATYVITVGSGNGYKNTTYNSGSNLSNLSGRLPSSIAPVTASFSSGILVSTLTQNRLGFNFRDGGNSTNIKGAKVAIRYSVPGAVDGFFTTTLDETGVFTITPNTTIYPSGSTFTVDYKFDAEDDTAYGSHGGIVGSGSVTTSL